MLFPRFPPDHGLPPPPSPPLQYTSYPSSLPRPTDASSSLDISRTHQGTPTRSSSIVESQRPGPSFTESSITSSASVATSPPTSLLVSPASVSSSDSLSRISQNRPTPTSESSLTTSNSIVISTFSGTSSITASPQSLSSTSLADNVSATSTSGAVPAPLPVISKHSLPSGAIIAAVAGPIIVITLVGAVALFFLRRKRQGYARPSSSSGYVGLAESAAGMRDKEKLFRSETRNTDDTNTPTPAYAPYPHHGGVESESTQPMLLGLQPHSGPSVVDRAYYTGMDTTSQASIPDDSMSGYHDSVDGSFSGEAPPPYVRSIMSGASVTPSAGETSTVRPLALAEPITDRHDAADESFVEGSETPRANLLSPFADPVAQAHVAANGSPFDDTLAANDDDDDDDTVSEISEPETRARGSMSEVSDLSYQPSLRSLQTNDDGRMSSR